MTRVGLEIGKSWVFASAVDWPGWARRGKGEEAAIEALDAYAERYRPVAGAGFDPGGFEVVGRVSSAMMADFGAPGERGPWDDEPLEAAEAERQAGILAAAWADLDRVVAAAPAALTKGPRGGGRDRDAIAEHVREAERAYGRKVGVRVPPRTPWPEQRAALLPALAAGAGGAWSARYGLRRVTWHVLDHAWEIEDRRPAPG